jgi:soluble lytic murein transglycosylase-like protein
LFPRKSWALPAKGAEYAATIFATEDMHRIPRNLLARLIYQESRYRDDIIQGNVTSPAGAVGIAQIVPQWHPNVDPLDPYESIRYAGSYLRGLFDRFGGWPMALAAYNWGEGNLNRALRMHGSDWLDNAPMETRNYVTQILGDVPI